MYIMHMCVYIYIYIYAHTYVRPRRRSGWTAPSGSPRSSRRCSTVDFRNFITITVTITITIIIIITVTVTITTTTTTTTTTTIITTIITTITMKPRLRHGLRSISEISSCFLGRDPGTLKSDIVSTKTSTINLFGFETLKLKIRRLKLWKPTV